uniref:Vacuolar ATPase assembly protein VMA22 n=1 Tax=Haemonchus contortus TaxID=6289 RepID=A0A7I4XXG9_HAECO
MEELNSISFERLQCVSDYCKLMIQLESYLTSARSDISKARTLQGVALSSTFNIDVQSPEPSVRVTFNEDKFSITDGSDAKKEDASGSEVRKRKEDEPSKKEEEAEKPKKQIPNFRPFGIFEPLCAKEARKTMHSAVEIVCELATLQCEIKRLDSKTLSIKKSLNLDQDLCQKLERVLKV